MCPASLRNNFLRSYEISQQVVPKATCSYMFSVVGLSTSLGPKWNGAQWCEELASPRPRHPLDQSSGSQLFPLRSPMDLKPVLPSSRKHHLVDDQKRIIRPKSTKHKIYQTYYCIYTLGTDEAIEIIWCRYHCYHWVSRQLSVFYSLFQLPS